MRNKVWIFLVLIFFVSCGEVEQLAEEHEGLEKGRFLDDWTYDVFIENNDIYKNTYKLWVPEDINPRAILVLTVGGLGDGTNMVNNSNWRAFARAENLALVGAYVSSNGEESAQNLRFAIRKIVEARGLHNILGLPYLLRGHSSGGIFSYTYAQIYIKSTLAWANIKGTLNAYDQPLPPGLFIIGENDLENRNQSIKSAFLKQRRLGGLSVLAEEPNAGHGAGNSDDLIRAYFSAILDRTIDENGVVSSIDTNTIFLGNIDSVTVWPYAQYPGNKEEASCLINQQFSQDWIDFMKNQ